MQVLVCDPVAEEGTRLLQEAGLQVTVRLKMKEEEIEALVPTCDALVVRSETKVTRRIIKAAEQLKIIGRAGVGTDNIDVEAATERGVLVVNAPEGNTVAAAEHTFGMMLALARNIPQANASLKQGLWEKKKYLGVELRGKVLGILGLGKIGGEVARRARAFGMCVIAHDPYIAPEHAAHFGVELASLEEVLAGADFLTIHLPLTAETRHLVNQKAFQLMKPGVRLLNVARGGIVDEAALYEALVSGKVAGAAVDVFEQEPVSRSPLFNLENVIVTPHLGASTAEAQINVSVEVAQEIIRALRGEPVRNAVNIPSIKPELFSFLKPYFDLAEKLGKLGAQMVNGPIQQAVIGYNGEIAGYDVSPLTNSFLKGLLQPVLEESVNYVNAPVVAKNRGIRVVEKKSQEAETYTNLISIWVKTAQEERSLAGTLFQNNEPRIVRINGFTIDAVPRGHMLVIPHIDKPRIIGPVGNLIGAQDVNIAGMQVGRKVIGGEAVMFLAIDAPLPPKTLVEISRIDGVLDVKYVYL